MNPIALLVGLGVPAKFVKPLLIALGVLLLLVAIFVGVKIHDHRVVAAHEAQLQQRAAPATDQAAAERANDTIATTQHEQELHNVIAAQSDQPISPTSHALACERLRHAGKHPASCS